MAMNVDEKTLSWSAAHVEHDDFYAVPQADERFFVAQMTMPVVATIAAIAAARGRRLKILEVGCGSGVDSICLALQGHDVTTLDISSRLLAQARNLATVAAQVFGAGALPLRFVQGDVFDLAAYADQYDVVLSFGVTVIWRERAKRLAALANMRAALMEDGELLLGTTHTLNPLFRMLPLSPLVADLADHNLPILEDEVAAVGLAVTRRGAVGLSDHFDQWLAHPAARLPLRLANWVFEHLPAGLQLPIAPHVFVVARKGAR